MKVASSWPVSTIYVDSMRQHAPGFRAEVTRIVRDPPGAFCVQYCVGTSFPRMNVPSELNSCRNLRLRVGPHMARRAMRGALAQDKPTPPNPAGKAANGLRSFHQY